MRPTSCLAALVLGGFAAVACSTSGKGITVSGGPSGSGAGSGSGSGSGSGGGGCSVDWEGGTRTFGAPKALSSDPASSVVAAIFPSDGPPELLISEPGTSQLVLAAADGSGAPQRADSDTLAATGSSALDRRRDRWLRGGGHLWRGSRLHQLRRRRARALRARERGAALDCRDGRSGTRGRRRAARTGPGWAGLAHARRQRLRDADDLQLR